MTQLTDLQNEIKEKVLKSKGKEIITLRGYAGTGKTYTATEIIKEKLKQDKKNSVCVIAPTNAALGVLRNKLQDFQTYRLKFKTLANLMTTPQQYVQFMDFKFNLDDIGMHELSNMLTSSFKCENVHEIIIRDTKMKFNNATQSYEKEDIFIINKEMLHKALSKKLKGLKLDQIKVDVEFIYSQPSEIRDQLKDFESVVIDEMPMVNQDETDLLEDAMRLSNNENAQSKVASKSLTMNTPISLDKYPTYLFVGDNGQLQPVNGVTNKYMKEEALKEKNNIYQLTEVLRSTDKISKIGQLVNRKMKLSHIADVFPNEVKYYSGSTETFIKDNIEQFANSDISLTFTNKNVNLLNKLIREYKGYANSRDVKEGEQIIVTSNSRSENGEILFANGEEYFIEKIFTDEEAEKMLLKDEDSIFTNIRNRLQDNKEFKDIFDFVKVIIQSGDFKLAILKDNDKSKYAWISTDLNYNKSFSFDQSILKLDDLAMINGSIAPVVKANFGYARTVYKAQGSEWDSAAILLTKTDLYITKGKTNLPYTAMTRPKSELKVFIEK